MSGLHPGFWIRGGRIGKFKNVGGAKSSAVQMNLPDPGGG